MRRRLAPALTCLALAGCQPADAPEPPAASAHRRTLRLDQDSDHLVEIARYQDLWYSTNSNDGLSAVRLLPTGDMQAVFPRLDMGIRCTTAAVHEPSAMLFCSNECDGNLYPISLEDPVEPELTDPVHIHADPGELVPVFDLHVWGDALWIGAYDLGLWRAEIGDDGRPGAPTRVASPGNVRHVSHDADRVVALVAGRGIVVLEASDDPGDPSWVEVGSIEIDAPLIDLYVDEGRAAVAMGSAGAAVYDLGPQGPLLESSVSPRAVVVSAALHGDRLALGTLSGLHVYDLAGPEGEANATAFVSAGDPDHAQPGSVLDLRFESRDDLLATDWYTFQRVELREEGEITDLERPAGIYVAAGAPVAFPVRNHGALEMEIAVSVFDEVLARAKVPAHGEATVHIEPDPGRFPPDTVRELIVSRFAPNGAFIGRQAVLVLTSAEDHDPAVDGRPAPGQPFPDIRLARFEADPLDLPLPATPQRLVFFTEDCQAMWAEIEDLAWLWRQGLLDDGSTPAFLTTGTLHAGAPGTSFAERFRVTDVPAGFHDNVPPEIDDYNAPLVPLYGRGFALDRLESAAAHPSDYLLDDAGRVRAVEREYRGAFPLRAEP